jgi:hypothetical protein
VKSWDLRLLNLIGIVRLFPVGKRNPEDYDKQGGNESPDNDHEVRPAKKVLNFALSFTVRDT